MVNIESYCGIECSKCDYREQCGCKGCKASDGNMFYGECKVAKCAIGKQRRFCGECAEFPCELLKSMSYDKEQGDNGARIENCSRMKEELVRNARAGIDPVSVCGHHCDYCFMGQWCGGCRSDYNCCSYATICPDGKCPNVVCAAEHKYDGCYDCPELMSCKKGYYSNENEYAAKATAAFIHKYGKEEYTKTLKKAIESGMAYAKDLDMTGSVEDALKLLEQYK